MAKRQIKCIHCNQRYQFGDDEFGKMFTCIECGKDFLIGETRKVQAPEKKAAISRTVVIVVGLIVGIGILGGVLLFKKKPEKIQTEKEVQGAVTSQDSALTKYQKAQAFIGAGDIPNLMKCLENFDVNYVDESKITLLCYAAKSGNKQIAQILLDAGARINRADKNGFAPVFYAAEKGDLEMLSFLLSNKADLNAGDTKINSPLNIAVEKNNLPLVRFLMTNGSLPYYADDVEKPIFKAIKKGYNDCVRELLSKYDIETVDPEGNSILMVALECGNNDIVQLALSRAASILMQNNKGVPVYFQAVRLGNKDIISLIDPGSISLQFRSKDGTSLPMVCAQAGNWSLLHKTLVEGNKNFRDEQGRNVLFYACAHNDIKIVEELIGKNIEINGPGLQSSALYQAVLSGNNDIAKFLLGKSAGINLLDENGNNILMVAAAAGNLSSLKLIVEAGGDVLATNKKEQTALDIAVEKGNPQMVAVLAELTNNKQAAVVQAQINTLLADKSSNYSKMASELELIEKKYLNNSQIKTLVETAQTNIRNQEKTRAGKAILDAIAAAREDRTYGAAIKRLEAALVENSLADNLYEAQDYLNKLKAAEQTELEKLARVKERREKLEKMTYFEQKSEIHEFINSWLSDMRLDKDTSQYWATPSGGSVFFNVKSWNIIDNSSYSRQINTIVVSIDSSNKGGMPIRNNWKVVIRRDDYLDWKISSIKE